jgi:amino acid permease
MQDNRNQEEEPLLDNGQQTNKSDQEQRSSVFNPDGLSSLQILPLILKALIGIGVLNLPFQMSRYGILGVSVSYPIIAALIVYYQALIIKEMNKDMYKGNSYSEYVSTKLSKGWSYVSQFSI